MREFVISTESNADLAPEFVSEHNICVIPHYYTVEEEVYGEDKELSVKEFYDTMRAGKKVATIASNPAVIQEKFSAIAKTGRDILHISFSSALSGGCSNVIMTANEVMEEYPDTKIKVVDTLSASIGEMLMIMEALKLQKEGLDIEETAAALELLVPHINVQFTVDDLGHLQRGGRLSKTSAIVGTLIDIKPILYVNEEGKLLPLGKTRGRKKSLATLVSNMGERLGEWKDKQIAVGIIHGDCEEDAQHLAKLVTEKYGFENIIIRPIGPSIGAHSGPGAVGIIYLGEHR